MQAQHTLVLHRFWYWKLLFCLGSFNKCMHLGEYLSQAQWIAKTLRAFHPSISLGEYLY